MDMKNQNYQFSGITLLLFVLGLPHFLFGYVVPNEMWYCGVKLKFTPEARLEIQKKVDFLLEKPKSFKILTDRANLYMPFVTDAFKQIGVPDDIRFIAIQESGMRGDAVSSSQAVGFWQMKDFTAKEVGLEITEHVDERKHIFRSSIGAARYFHKNYRRFDNWIYAIIAYYAGGTGALPYVDSRYYGANEMTVDEDLHWYAQKAIAHKIAFEQVVNEQQPPEIWLLPKDNDGVVNISSLAEQNKLDEEEFRKFNLWVSSDRLPAGKPFSYYVPQKNKPYVHVKDPHLNIFDPAPAFVSRGGTIAQNNTSGSQGTTGNNEKMNVIGNTTDHEHNEFSRWFSKRKRFDPPKTYHDTKVLEYAIEKEPLYTQEFVDVSEQMNLSAIASRYNISLRKLRKWNRLGPEEVPGTGQYVLLVRPGKAKVHIANGMQTIADVAILYNKKIDKLMKLNNIDTMSQMLLEGEKIFLKEQKPYEKYTIIYRNRTQRNAKDQYMQVDSISQDDSILPMDQSKFSENSTKPLIAEQNHPTEESEINQVGVTANGDEYDFTDENAWNQQTASVDDKQALNDANVNHQTNHSTPAMAKSTVPKPTGTNVTKKADSNATASANQTAQVKARQSKNPANKPYSSTSVAYQAGNQHQTTILKHEIKKGDTLWNISQRYGMTVSELRELNNLSNEDIKVGQFLNVKKNK